MIEFDGTSDRIELSSYRPSGSFSVCILMRSMGNGCIHVIKIGGGK